MPETQQLFDVSLQLGFWDRPQEFKALGIWHRNGPGEDGKVEVYLPRHRDHWNDAFGAEFGYNPDGVPQTKVVLSSDKVHVISSPAQA